MTIKEKNLRNGIPRYFSSCDCARVARNVVEDRDVSPESVIACVAKGLGFTYLGLSNDILPILDPVDDQDISGPLEEIENLLAGGFFGFVGPYKPGTGTVIKRQLARIVAALPIGKLLIALVALIGAIKVAQNKADLCNCKPVDAWIEPNTCNCKDAVYTTDSIDL